MYECPNRCGSTSFTQQVVQRETVEADGSGGVLHIDVDSDPVVKRLMCDGCGAEVHSASLDVYAVVVHPPDTTSDVVNVYADQERAETVADELRSEEQGIEVAVKQYEVAA
jgi:hypothetical protein